MKSHVSLGQHVCPVCLETHDSGEVLLDTMLAETLNRYTTTGWGLCPIHKNEQDEGYDHLVVVKNDPDKKSTFSLVDADRTGDAISMSEDLFREWFGFIGELPNPKLLMIDVELFEAIKTRMADIYEEHEEEIVH